MRTIPTQPLEWLFPPARRRVLALLLMSPEQRWHLRDIARRTGLAVGTVRRELEGLTASETLTRLRDGNRTYYQANRRCPIFEDLQSLLAKTAGLADVLREALEPLRGQIALAFIYGSTASGKARAGSDVDVMVVGDVEGLALHKAISRGERRLGRPVNYSLMTAREYAARRRRKDGFVARVLAEGRIILLGGEDEV